MLHVRIPPSLEKRLEKLARRSGRSKSYFAREAILRQIQDFEDVFEAEEILVRIRAGKEKVFSLEEVSARLGIRPSK